MKFRELEVNALFTFHSFSHEFYRKVSETQCICISCGDCVYDEQEVDEPFSLEQTVHLYNPVKVEEKPIGVGLIDNLESVDRFQPLSLVTALRQYMRETRNNSLLSEEKKEGIRLGLAWAIAEVMEQATAKDRFTPRER